MATARTLEPIDLDPLEPAYLDRQTFEEFLRRWDYQGHKDDGCPFERKAVDWGQYDGRTVAVDYANP